MGVVSSTVVPLKNDSRPREKGVSAGAPKNPPVKLKLLELEPWTALPKVKLFEFSPVKIVPGVGFTKIPLAIPAKSASNARPLRISTVGRRATRARRPFRAFAVRALRRFSKSMEGLSGAGSGGDRPDWNGPGPSEIKKIILDFGYLTCFFLRGCLPGEDAVWSVSYEPCEIGFQNPWSFFEKFGKGDAERRRRSPLFLPHFRRRLRRLDRLKGPADLPAPLDARIGDRAEPRRFPPAVDLFPEPIELVSERGPGVEPSRPTSAIPEAWRNQSRKERCGPPGSRGGSGRGLPII